MNKLKLFLSIIVFSVLTFSVNAQETFLKEFNKEYKVAKDALLKLNNKFGNIECETWDQNKVSIKVVVEVYKMSQKKAENLLEKFDVEFSGTKNLVSATTKIAKLGRGNKSFSVNYYVKLPKTLKLNIMNKYGDVYLPSMEGSTDLTVKYGDLQVDKLLNTKNLIIVKYGELNADKINEARIDFAYSDLSIDEINVLDLKSSYSEISIDRVLDLELKSSFDDVEIDEVETLYSKTSYSDVEIGYLKTKIDIVCNFGALSIDRIDQEFESVVVDSDYAGVELRFENGSSFDLEVYVKYGDFHSRFKSDLNREKLSHSSYRYTGKVGESAKSKVEINAKFASVEIK